MSGLAARGCGPACVAAVADAAGRPDRARAWRDGPVAGLRRIRRDAGPGGEARVWAAPPAALARALGRVAAPVSYRVLAVPAPVPERTPTGRLTRVAHRVAAAATRTVAAAIRATGHPAVVAVARGRHWVVVEAVAADLSWVAVLDTTSTRPRARIRRAAWVRSVWTPVRLVPGERSRYGGTRVALLPRRRPRG